VVAVIAKAMAKEREKRYQTPQEFLEDLQRLRGGQRLLHTVPANALPELSRGEIIAATLPGTRVSLAKDKAPVQVDPFFMKIIALLVVGGILGGVWYSMQGMQLGTKTTTTSDDKPAWATIIGSDSRGRFAEALIGKQLVQLRSIPAGQFMMGSPEQEPGRQANEVAHKVNVTSAFWLLSTEVSQPLYQEIMGNNPSSKIRDHAPVAGVSWHEAQDFCAKLRAQGIPAQLPSEAQWEYACRAGHNGTFSSEPLPNQQGWMAPAALATIWRETPADEAEAAALRWIAAHVAGDELGIQACGKLSANAWGLFDMHGNVLEWCRDAWDGKTPYANSDASNSANNPISTIGDLSSARGGCWFFPPEKCRAASRHAFHPDATLNYVGFRFIIEEK
jgi:formylglycine-generating enzyme required for sulfatase activity